MRCNIINKHLSNGNCSRSREIIAECTENGKKEGMTNRFVGL
jgi:hypothetical protein